jgi:uncharacterized membrane protein
MTSPRATYLPRTIGVVDPRPYLSARDGRAGHNGSTRRNQMPSMTKLALTAAIVLSTAVTASAATDHRRAHGHPAIYDAAPAIISDACQPVGPPCRTHPDGW